MVVLTLAAARGHTFGGIALVCTAMSLATAANAGVSIFRYSGQGIQNNVHIHAGDGYTLGVIDIPAGSYWYQVWHRASEEEEWKTYYSDPQQTSGGTVTVQVDMPPGYQVQMAIWTPDGRVREYLIWTAEQSDLIIDEISLDPITVFAGETVTATIKIKNQGDLGCNGSFLYWWADRSSAPINVSDSSGWRLVGGVLDGEIRTITMTFPAPSTTGNKTFWALVHSAVSEADETNNSKSATYTVRYPAVALTVTPASVSVPQGGDSSMFSVSANVPWTATDDADWLAVTPPSGVDDGTVTVAATENTSTASRSATVTVTGGGITRTATITQAGAQDPYLAAAPGGVDGSPAMITTAYEGFAYDDDGTVRGTVVLSAKAAVTTSKGVTATNWTVTAKATLQSATVSFSGKAAGALGGGVITNRTSEALEVDLGADVFYGRLSGGRAGGTLNVAGARNVFADKKDAAAQERLNEVRGLYNVALVERSTLNVQLSTLNEIVPAGYLTLNIGNAGAVKLAGRLADGTAVSGAAKLLEGLNEDGWLAVPVYKPLYAKKGFVGGLLWLNPEDKVIRVDDGYGWFVDWVCEDPKKGTFEKELDVVGGAYVGRDFEIPSYFGASVPEDLPPPASGLSGAWAEEAFPWELAVTVSGTKWSLPKATPPKKAGTAYVYSGEGMSNPSGATLMYTAKTGLFKGAFKLYYDGIDAKGKAQHKTASVSYTGVVVPMEEGGFTGLGSGTATINKQKTGVPVWLGE
jgi:hypothetical protein